MNINTDVSDLIIAINMLGEDLVGLEGEKITAFENNLDEIINALTNINHPAFNLEESKDILADYYTNMKMQAYENNYYANGGKKTWEENVEGVEEGKEGKPGWSVTKDKSDDPVPPKNTFG